MLKTIWADVYDGQIRLSENVELPDGTKLLVIVLSDEDHFWLAAGESSLAAVWDNAEDDAYAQLLEK